MYSNHPRKFLIGYVKVKMPSFKETPRMYNADEVDSEIAILTQSRNFWRKKAEELQEQIDKLKGE